MGAPGAGKGTQAKLISNHYRIPAISTGSIFRANIAAKTELGQRVDALIRGAKRLMEPDARGGFLLDGYPRTSEQVEALDIILADLRTNLDGVISLDVDTDQLVDRLLKRAQIEGRQDDTAETIRHRMDVYHEETAELLDTYRNRGILVEVDGEGSVDEVAERIFEAIDKFANR